MKAIRIGTRGSALALWQASTVAGELSARGAEVDVIRITTQGDRRQEAPLSEASGKGIFVKEIEDALLCNEIDVAVHSSKDMAAAMPAGLVIAGVLPREDPRDALVLPAGQGQATGLRQLGATPRIGTSSPRRVAQLRTVIPTAQFHAIRGNVETRLRKLDEGQADALVLAAAGLRRLGLRHRISAYIPIEECMPAPGQGIVAVQVRIDDQRTYALVSAFSDPLARLALAAEQAVVVALGGGCQLPLGVFAQVADAELVVRAVASSLDGRHAIAGEARGPQVMDVSGAAALGERLAEDLMARGARRILES